MHAQDEFNFGQVFIGCFTRLPLTLHNTSGVTATLMVDLTMAPEFQLLCPKDAWTPQVGRVCSSRGRGVRQATGLWGHGCRHVTEAQQGAGARMHNTSSKGAKGRSNEDVATSSPPLPRPWTPQDYDSCPLTSIGAAGGGGADSVKGIGSARYGSLPDSKRGSRRASRASSALGFRGAGERGGVGLGRGIGGEVQRAAGRPKAGAGQGGRHAPSQRLKPPCPAPSPHEHMHASSRPPHLRAGTPARSEAHAPPLPPSASPPACDGFKYRITVNPGKQLPLLLMYRPSEEKASDVELALHLVAAGVPVPPVRKVRACAALRGTCSETSCDRLPSAVRTRAPLW